MPVGVGVKLFVDGVKYDSFACEIRGGHDRMGKHLKIVEVLYRLVATVLNFDDGFRFL